MSPQKFYRQAAHRLPVLHLYRRVLRCAITVSPACTQSAMQAFRKCSHVRSPAHARSLVNEAKSVIQSFQLKNGSQSGALFKATSLLRRLNMDKSSSSSSTGERNQGHKQYDQFLEYNAPLQGLDKFKQCEKSTLASYRYISSMKLKHSGALCRHKKLDNDYIDLLLTPEYRDLKSKAIAKSKQLTLSRRRSVNVKYIGTPMGRFSYLSYPGRSPSSAVGGMIRSMIHSKHTEKLQALEELHWLGSQEAVWENVVEGADAAEAHEKWTAPVELALAEHHQRRQARIAKLKSHRQSLIARARLASPALKKSSTLKAQQLQRGPRAYIYSEV